MKFVFVLAIVLVSFLATSASAQSLNVIQQKLAQSLPADLGQLYVEAETALRNNNVSAAREKYDALLERAKVLKDRLGIGTGLVGQGEVYNALQNYSSAFDSFKAALPYLTDPNALAIEGWAYAALGEVSLRLNDLRQAISAFEKAISIGANLLVKSSDSEKLIISSVLAEVFRQTAIAYTQLGQFDDAVKNAILTAHEYAAVGNKKASGLASSSAGYLLLFKLKKPQEAIPQYAAAMTLFEEIGDHELVTSSTLSIAWSHFNAKDLQQAQSSFVNTLKKAHQYNLPEIALEAKFGLARISDDGGNFIEALTQYREVLTDAKSIPKKSSFVSEGNILALMGSDYRMLSRYEPAIEHLSMAATKYREQGERNAEAETLTRIAEIYLWLGEYDSAGGYYKKALLIYNEQGTVSQRIRVLALLALVAHRDDTSTGAIRDEYLESASKLKKSAEEKFDDKLKTLWKAKEELMNWEPDAQDLDYGRAGFARRFNKNLDDPNIQKNDYIDEALFNWQVRKSREFAGLWNSALPALGPEYRLAVGVLYQNWGLIQLLAGDAKNATTTLFLSEQYLSTLVLDREISIELAKTYFYRAEAYRQLKDYDFSLLNFNFSFFIAEALHTPEIHWVYSGLGRTYTDMGKYETALRAYRKALGIVESVQTGDATDDIKINIFEGSAYVYRHFISLLLTLYKKTGSAAYLDEAFEYTQKGKARVFLEMLQKATVTRQTGETPSIKQTALEQEIAKIHVRLRKADLFNDESKRLLDRLEALRAQQQLERQAVPANSGNGQAALLRTAKITEVQMTLPEDSVLFEYIESDKGITLLAISKDQVREFAISVQDYSAGALYLQTLKLPLIGSDELQKHIDLGVRLYRMLIEPAAELLRNKKRLIVSPDGSLHYFPFETLIVPATGGVRTKSVSDIHYLIKDISITYAQSASAFVWQAEHAKSPKPMLKYPLLAFGDPIYSSELSSNDRLVKSDDASNAASRGMTLRRLEFSGDEIIGVAKIWGLGPKSEHVNLREKASVENLKDINLAEYAILHFAAHAVVQTELVPFSQPSIVLTAKNTSASKGLLQFSDILELKQNADLVILSACDTGLGQLKGGEGIIGLTRAFLYSGASSAVVSLWKVEDQSTALLMQKFHERLKSGQNKDEALRQAKLDIMKTQIQLKATGSQESLAAPFFWAPFILIGDGGPIHLN